MNTSIGLSVVVVNWNSGNCLGGLLESLEPLVDRLSRVIVVDNASQDGSADLIKDNSRIELLDAGKNLGFAGAANCGIDRVSTPLVLLLNPDVVLHPDAVKVLCQEIESRPYCGIATGKLCSQSHKTPQISLLPNPWSMLRDAIFINEFLAFVGLDSDSEFTKLDTVANDSCPQVLEVEQPAAAFWILRRKAWESIGGFDCRFSPAWFEDVDFCFRLLSSGWKILHFPEITVGTHVGGIAVEQMGYSLFVEIYYRNMLLYLSKHHQKAYPLLWPFVQLGIQMRRRIIGRWR